MIVFLYIAGLVIAAASVSTLGALFSIQGLARLFSGSATAVTLMAAALEFSKFVVSAFLHRTWSDLNRFYRTYLLLAVITLSLITSMGIFGFLSDAYQASSVDFSQNQIKIESLKADALRNEEEIRRINRSIEEIPEKRVTRRIQARADAEKFIRKLTARSNEIAEELKQAHLKNLDISMKVGPLIYVSRAFNEDVDTVVKWLILVFVLVFDPLAICLVIATSEALKLRQTIADGKSHIAPVTQISKKEPKIEEKIIAPEPLKPEPSLEKSEPALAKSEPIPEAAQTTLEPEQSELPLETLTMRFAEPEQKNEDQEISLPKAS